MRTIPLVVRFWKYVKKTRGCWHWVGHKNTHGYGSLTVKRGVCVTTHRYSWELHFGEIPKGMWVLHHCDNRACVNPDHLFTGTPQDNSSDMVYKDRHCYGERNGHSKLKESQVLHIRELRTTGLPLSAIAARFNVSPSSIHLICKRQQWKHL
jgi:hypothetical protein